MVKCPSCGSNEHYITARAYETIVEHKRGRVIFQKTKAMELYPMFYCLICGHSYNTWGNTVNLKEELEILKESEERR